MWVAVILGVVFVVGAGFMLGGRSGDNSGVDLRTAERFSVLRGDLTITLLQAGELAAKKADPIINETEQSCKILEIVEDGATVKKGDVLVEMDAAELSDRVLRQQTQVAGAEAGLEPGAQLS